MQTTRRRRLRSFYLEMKILSNSLGLPPYSELEKKILAEEPLWLGRKKDSPRKMFDNYGEYQKWNVIWGGLRRKYRIRATTQFTGMFSPSSPTNSRGQSRKLKPLVGDRVFFFRFQKSNFHLWEMISSLSPRFRSRGRYIFSLYRFWLPKLSQILLSLSEFEIWFWEPPRPSTSGAQET